MSRGVARLPWLLIAVTSLLVLLGLSAISRGDELSGGALYQRQLVWAGLALPALFVSVLLPYRKLRHYGWPLLMLTIGLLVLVYFMPARNGARRWIPLGPILFQPSELAKLVTILALAQYLMFRENYRKVLGLIPPFLIALIPVALILREPDLGTSLLFLPVLLAMLFAAGARPHHLAIVVMLGVLVAPVLWMGMSAEQKSRVVTVFTQKDQGPVPRGDGYHLFQSKRMHSLGGEWGSAISGVPPVDPSAYHLPAARTDFVFCLVTERWGFVGAMVTLVLYALLFLQGIGIARRTRDPYGRLIAVGITALLAVQTSINLAMTVGLTPITGLTLPLMSYGGSSLLFTAVAIGLLINIHLRNGYHLGPTPFKF
ncbi:Peptidoglycan glycosyltransferase MrdB [Calycomorphotria hydatis]|uniref:Probable peptidoglycan glycosyltransferase FtsW n=2 Tax=Calycomorphotria hydatis TaxID=2528027 RepID=A0A517T5P2_9PLAN|nr:Peptidoglycan glycosyltransferase MrdB [Calycomorphotria hydatis]